jgi:hypothetical protein
MVNKEVHGQLSGKEVAKIFKKKGMKGESDEAK